MNKTKILDWLCRLMGHKYCKVCKHLTPPSFLDDGTCLQCGTLEELRRIHGNPPS